MKILSLLAVFAFGAPLALPPASPAVEGTGFTLTIDRDGGTWRAACEKGCAWREVRYECLEDPCSVTLDANGIVGGDRAPDSASEFAFVLSPVRNGWRANSIRGTAWTNLSWGCAAPMFCRARVDESGVQHGWTR